MKALLLESKIGMELRIQNKEKTILISKEGESKEDFLKRVKEDELLDLTIDDKSFGLKLKKVSSKKLTDLYSRKTGVEAEVIKEHLATRNVHVENGSNKATFNATAGEKVDSKEEEKEAKPKKVLKKQLSDEEALALKEKAEVNVGHAITYHCSKKKAKSEGVIKSVRLDKRNNFSQYRILDEDGNMYGKGIADESIIIGDKVPVPEKVKAEKPAKEVKAKDDKKGKIEKKPAIEKEEKKSKK